MASTLVDMAWLTVALPFGLAALIALFGRKLAPAADAGLRSRGFILQQSTVQAAHQVRHGSLLMGI